MSKVILLIFIIMKEIASCSYTTLSEKEENAFIDFAYSKSAYDIVGMLCIIDTDKLQSIGSAIYIGGRTCLTAAHCKNPHCPNYSVGFETKTQEFTYYNVDHFIVHPEYKSNENYDLAVIILDRPVEGLDSLIINNDFSAEKVFRDYQHLLTYAGYGVKFCWDDWFVSTNDDKRRKRWTCQAYTDFCSVKPKHFGIHATPYGQFNKTKRKRPVEKYEIPCRQGMSGGGVFNEENELIAIIAGTIPQSRPFNFMIDTYLFFARCANALIFFINLFSNCPTFVVDTDIMIDGSHAHSTTIAPLKDWINSVQLKYGA